MMLAQRIRKFATVALAGLAIAVVATPEALAQGRGGAGGPGGGMFGGMFGGGQGQMFEPTINSRDLDGYGQLFGLDTVQKDAVKTLFDGYQQQFAVEAKKVRDELEVLRDEAREARDPELWREMGEKTTAFQKKRNEMEQNFLNDFRSVLTTEQEAKWPKFERTRRREMTIGRGLMSGERVDVIKLVDDLKLSADERAAFNPILDQYEVDLDRELIERNKMQDDMQSRMRDLFSDPEAADDMIKKGRDIAVKVRDVNRRYAAQVESQLADDKKAQFNTAFRRESFPQIYRDTYATRVVEAAGKLEGLDDNQKSAIMTLREAYYRDLETVQRGMEKAQEESEMNFSISGMMNRRGGNNNDGGARRGGGGMFGESEAMGELRTKRRDIERGTEERIKAVLNEQQIAKLPTRGEDQERGVRGRGEDGADQQPRRRGGEGENNGDRPQRRPGRGE